MKNNSHCQMAMKICLLLLIVFFYEANSQVSKSIANFPNVEFYNNVVGTAKNVTFYWIDPVTTTDFDMHFYSQSATLSDLNGNSALALKFISKDASSVAYESNSTFKISFIKVKSSQTKPLRYKIVNGDLVNYGLFVPPSYQVNLVPFDILDNSECEMQFSRGSLFNSYSSSIVMDFYKPGLNPLTDPATFSLTFTKNTNQLSKTMPKFPGQWYLKQATTYRISNNQAGIVVENISISSTTSASSCNLMCQDTVTTIYNNILRKCDCRDPVKYIFNEVTQTCYLNCAIYNQISSQINATEMYPNNTDRCQCSSSTRSASATTITSYVTSADSTSFCSTDCQQIKNTISTGTVSASCKCAPDFYWDTTEKYCIINCTALNNTVVTSDSVRINSEKCYCRNKYQWVGAKPAFCGLNCSSIKNTGVINHLYFMSNGKSCPCVTGYTWDPLLEQ